MTILAVPAETTLLVGAASFDASDPSGPIVPCTSLGCTQRPSFAMVEYTETIWSGVAAIPWPYAVVARIVSFHWSSGRMMPLTPLGTRRRSRARARTVRGRSRGRTRRYGPRP